MNIINKENEKLLLNKEIHLSRLYRLFLFFILACIESILNVSSGIIASATKEIKFQLKLNDTKFGLFGTFNSVGRIGSSILFGILNQKVSRKWIVIIFVSFHALFLMFFKLTNNAAILISLRGLLGLTQTAPSVYVPVWINQYGLSNYKTIQITSIQLFQATGKLLGFLINIIIGLENWRNGFVIEGIILLVLSFLCLISSEQYFSRDLYPKKLDESKNKKSVDTIYMENGNKTSDDNKKKSNNTGNYFLDLQKILSNPLYILSLISRCIIHGLNTCLHYWISDFMRTVIKEEQVKVTIAYSMICFIGPLGGLLANTILKSYIGNYESKNSSWPIVILQSLASIFAINIGFMKSTVGISIITILFFIFNSSTLPLIQGILMSCTEKNLSGTAFAFASTCTQLATAGTTPIIYGMINDRFKHKYPWIAMVSMMSLHLLAIPLLILLAILRNKKFDEKSREKGEELREL